MAPQSRAPVPFTASDFTPPPPPPADSQPDVGFDANGSEATEYPADSAVLGVAEKV